MHMFGIFMCMWPTFAQHCSSRCTADWIPEAGIQSAGPQRPDCPLQRFRSADVGILSIGMVA